MIRWELFAVPTLDNMTVVREIDGVTIKLLVSRLG